MMSTRSRRIQITLGVVAAVVLISFAIAYQQLTDSTALTARITRTLSDAFGQRVELQEPAELESIFPRVTLLLPDMTSRGALGESYRLQTQINDTRASIPLLSLLRDSMSDLSVDTGGITAALEPIQSDSQSSPAEQNTPPFDLAYIRETMTTVVQDLVANVNVAEMDLVLHTPNSDYDRWHLSNARFNLNGGTGQLAATDINRIKTADNTSDSPNRFSTLLVDWTLTGNHRDLALKSDITLSASDESSDLSQGEDTAGDALTLTTHFRSTQNLLSLEHLTAESSWVKARFERGAPVYLDGLEVNGLLTVDHLDASPLMPTLSVLGYDTDKKERLFNYTPFATGIPTWLHVNVETIFVDVKMDENDVLSGALKSTVVDGNMQMVSDNLSVLGGNTDLNIEWLSENRYDTQFNATLSASDMALDRVRLDRDLAPVLDRGMVDLDIALSGRGPSPGHLVASMNGHLNSSISDAVLNKRNTTALDRGVVSWALERLSVTSSRVTDDSTGARLSDPLAIDCASMRVSIEQGRANARNGLVVELLDNTLYGSGFMDLHDETLGVAFRTRRKSLFDWSAISIARYLEIGGTLSQPDIQMNKYELARQGVLTASSVAWGPLPGIVYNMAESGIKNRGARQCVKSIH